MSVKYSDTLDIGLRLPLDKDVENIKEYMKIFQAFKCKKGSIEQNPVRMVHGVKKCPDTGQVFYLCSWEQKFLDNYFFTPQWVPAKQMLIPNDESYANLLNHKLVAEYY